MTDTPPDAKERPDGNRGAPGTKSSALLASNHRDTTPTPSAAPFAGIATMTPDVAADVTAWIRNSLADVDLALAFAYEHQVWRHLEHRSWEDYCAAEFDGLALIRLPRPDRQQLHAKLRAAGMPLRAIAAATGSAINTVRSDLESAQLYQADTPADVADEEVVTPEVVAHRVVGADGKAYPATTGKRRRAPLQDDVRKSTWEIEKAVTRLTRVRADDRFRSNRDAIVNMTRTRIVHTIAELLALADELALWDDVEQVLKTSPWSTEAVTR